MADISDEKQTKILVYNHISCYVKKSWVESTSMLFTTLLLYIGCLQFSSILMTPILALTIIRLFIIFHDMAHGSYFPSLSANRYVGYFIATLVITPFSKWKTSHNYHHTNSNKLNVPQYGQTAVWDLDTFRSSSAFHRYAYILAYGKYTLFTINPMIYFVLINRFFSKWHELFFQLVVWYLHYLYLDSSQYLYIVLSIWLATVIGVILFHVQHTFDGVYRADPGVGWSYFKNGLEGSSFLQVPGILKYFTCGIEYHHIHHLNPNVPCYMLKSCHDNSEGLFDSVKKIYISEIPGILKYSTYDAKIKKFRDVFNAS